MTLFKDLQTPCLRYLTVSNHLYWNLNVYMAISLIIFNYVFKITERVTKGKDFYPCLMWGGKIHHIFTENKIEHELGRLLLYLVLLRKKDYIGQHSGKVLWRKHVALTMSGFTYTQEWVYEDQQTVLISQFLIIHLHPVKQIHGKESSQNT